MRTTLLLCFAATTVAFAQQIDSDDIGGIVTNDKGTEGGVWVIAETTRLPVKFAKIVVTDDRGRYVVPDLPKASYTLWVRGYGLVDSRRNTIPQLLVLPAQSARQKRISGHRAST
jgi:hypothetical protein